MGSNIVHTCDMCGASTTRQLDDPDYPKPDYWWTMYIESGKYLICAECWKAAIDFLKGRTNNAIAGIGA